LLEKVQEYSTIPVVAKSDPPPLRPVSRSWRASSLIRVSAGIHAAAVGTLALAPRAWPGVVGAIASDHLTVVGAGLLPRCDWLGPVLVRLPGQAEARREIALTFDDGPDPATTPRVLDLLEARGARSSFFCIGRRVREHPELAAEIVRRGHAVENHSYRHSAGFWFLSPASLRDEIGRGQEAIARATGRVPRLFRAPAGIRSPLLEPALAQAGLHLVAWTRRGFDTITGDAERVLRRLLRGLAPGDILLLHDRSGRRTPAGSQVVLEVLPRLLDAIDAARLKPVAVDPHSAPA
jgi:peptidoglycan/xylan/chitin deacetylase (PgdA/CDA1 family)